MRGWKKYGKQSQRERAMRKRDEGGEARLVVKLVTCREGRDSPFNNLGGML